MEGNFDLVNVSYTASSGEMSSKHNADAVLALEVCVDILNLFILEHNSITESSGCWDSR